MPALDLKSEDELLEICFRLGAEREAGLARESRRPPSDDILRAVSRAAREGYDPLGDALCALRPPRQRRARGAIYTPPAIVESMVAWAEGVAEPARVVDPGAGSGRFLLAAARAFPRARLLGIEIDPVAATIARANFAAAGLGDRAEVQIADYRSAFIPPAAGQTLFIGNPPYVRHHDISPAWKAWFAERARAEGLLASQLAGLHLHFFLATLTHAVDGDAGSFITAAEWLDVNYGALARRLLADRLGLQRLDLLEPAAMPFADAQTTAVIASFQPGARGSIRIARLRSPENMGSLAGGKVVSRERLARTEKWTGLFRVRRGGAAGRVELGELCRVHRGQVTGGNRVWIAGGETPRLPPSVLYPAITRAKELFLAGESLDADAGLRRVIDLPENLEDLAPRERALAERFLRWAVAEGADAAYIARHRRPWWSVKLRGPAPILASYMARRPPVFVRNRVGARHLNIAHGIYPRTQLSAACLDALRDHLAQTVSIHDGRTYAGGLTKFEPREMERLLVPHPDVLGRVGGREPGSARAG